MKKMLRKLQQAIRTVASEYPNDPEHFYTSGLYWMESELLGDREPEECDRSKVRTQARFWIALFESFAAMDVQVDVPGTDRTCLTDFVTGAREQARSTIDFVLA